jgi:hypothetical protein
MLEEAKCIQNRDHVAGKCLICDLMRSFRIAKHGGLRADTVCALWNDCDVVHAQHVGDAHRRKTQNIDSGRRTVYVDYCILAVGRGDACVAHVRHEEAAMSGRVRYASQTEHNALVEAAAV